MRKCPLCGDKRRVEYPYKTYKTCANCQHTYQPRPPKKKFQNPDEEFNGGEGAVMGDHEKGVNSWLANTLFARYRPSSMLDIGCAYPYFAHCFKKMGVQSKALDGVYKDAGFVHDLDVPTQGVNWEDMKDGGYDAWKGTDLITMVHVLEHFRDPIKCLKRVYDNLADDGVLYIRSPNKDVAGIDRDHTDGHTLIHPSIFGNQSIAYAANKVGLHLHWVEHMENYGQSSWVFKKHPPKISLFMIVKNEEHHIADCIASVQEFCDEMVILDTGSTDRTIEIAEAAGATVYKSKVYTSETESKNFNFAKARNEAMRYATGDWLFWMDADDRLECKRMILSPQFDAYYTNIVYGGTAYDQVRLFRSGWDVHFKGAVHEFPVIDSCRLGTLPECNVHHTAGNKPGRVERNLSILRVEYEEDPKNKRTIFYLANASREAQKHDEAIALYKEYIASGGNFHDETAIAHYYLALTYYCQFKLDLALKAAHEAMAYDDKWGEPYSLAGECYFYKGQYLKAISYLTIALEMPFPTTIMFVEKNRYRETPKLWLSYCYEKLGKIDKAKEWAVGNAQRAKELAQRKYVIEVRRPGALGDVLCTTPAVRELRKKYPDAHIRYVTHGASKQILQCNPDIDEIVEDSTGKYADQQIEFAYPMNEGYPYSPMTRHLTQYFAENAGVTLSDDKSSIFLLPDDVVKMEHKKPVITFAVKTGWSKYKDWPLERWAQLIKLFPQYQFIQLGAAGETLIDGAQHMCGKLTLRESFSVLQQSDLFIGLDSVFNHATRALDVPAVILFGSTSPIGSGYDINTNLWSEYECSPCYRENNAISAHPMTPCPHDHKCMAEYMTVKRVAEAVEQKLNVKSGSARSKALPITN